MTRTRWKSLAVFFVILAVLAAGCRSTTGRSVGQNIDDKASNLTKIDVDVTSGTVYLTGNVDSAEQKSRAERIAQEVNGVRSVVNNLQVQKQ
jgi:diphthamide synthase (EF-2-diphthine--ammonia ligase)